MESVPAALEVVLDRSKSMKLDPGLSMEQEARVIKHRSLVGAVIAKGDHCDIPLDTIIGVGGPSLMVRYEVVETKPEREVRVTSRTKLKIIGRDILAYKKTVYTLAHAPRSSSLSPLRLLSC